MYFRSFLGFLSVSCRCVNARFYWINGQNSCSLSVSPSISHDDSYKSPALVFHTGLRQPVIPSEFLFPTFFGRENPEFLMIAAGWCFPPCHSLHAIYFHNSTVGCSCLACLVKAQVGGSSAHMEEAYYYIFRVWNASEAFLDMPTGFYQPTKPFPLEMVSIR